MRRHFQLMWLTIGIMPLLFSSGCGDIKPVWKGEVDLEPQGYTLHYSEIPVELNIDISHEPEPVEVMMEMVISYYAGIARNHLPMFISLEDEKHNIVEHTTDIILKEEDELMGVPQENEIDYRLTHIAIPRMTLNPSIHTLRIYANDEEQESVYGIVKLEIRLYKIEELESEE